MGPCLFYLLRRGLRFEWRQGQLRRTRLQENSYVNISTTNFCYLIIRFCLWGWGFFVTQVHITCAASYSLLEDANDEAMGDPFFIYCKEHGPHPLPRLNPWARWVKQKADVMARLNRHIHHPENLAGSQDPIAAKNYLFEDPLPFLANSLAAHQDSVADDAHRVCMDYFHC